MNRIAFNKDFTTATITGFEECRAYPSTKLLQLFQSESSWRVTIFIEKYSYH